MDDCSICYESITASTGHCTLGCTHTFHLACLSRWAQNTASCPLCRKELGNTEVIPKVATEIEIPMRHNTYNGQMSQYISRWSEPLIVRVDARSGLRIIHNERSVHIGDDIRVPESDILEVMRLAQVSRGSAILALRENDGNMAEAIYDLDHTQPEEEEPVPPRNPLEPTDEMFTAWALKRLFSKGTVLDKDEYDSLEYLRHRTSEMFRYGCWMNSEYREIPKKRRADSL